MTTRVPMHWKSFYGNEELLLEVPETWDVRRVGLNAAAPTTDADIRKAITHPISGPRLADLAKGKRSACIAVDDLTKPTEAWRSAPVIVEELVAAGVPEEEIYFIISLGTHRPLTLDEFRKKLGRRIADNFRVYNHSPYQNNRFLGTTTGGTDLHIDALFLDAEVKVAIGMLMPHNLAGFSGGGKIILPGLASIDTVEANHRSTLRGLQGKIGVLGGNRVRADIEEAAEMAGLDFIVNSIHGEDGRTAGIFAGAPRETYPVAVSAAQQVYACDVEYQCDIGIFNAFPRDNWFLLSLSSLDVWASRTEDGAVVRSGGTIVIINHCSEGAGEHGLHGKGMKHYVMRDEHGTFKEILRGRDVVMFSPNLHLGVLRDYYRRQPLLCREWSEVLRFLQDKHGGSAKVSVYPCGALQMDRAVLANA